jgi:hypothetical protein
MPHRQHRQIHGQRSLSPTSNIYVCGACSAAFMVVVAAGDLLALNLWNDGEAGSYRQRLSCRGIASITHQACKYKTVWRFRGRRIIDQAPDRGIPSAKARTELHVQSNELRQLTSTSTPGARPGSMYYLEAMTPSSSRWKSKPPNLGHGPWSDRDKAT